MKVNEISIYWAGTIYPLYEIDRLIESHVTVVRIFVLGICIAVDLIGKKVNK